jgi:chromosome segregation ATPase
VNTLEDILKQILSELKMVNNRIDNLEFNIGELKTDVTELKAGQQELITDVKQVKLAVLETNRMVKHIESDIDLLFEKTTNNERELNRLNKLQ